MSVDVHALYANTTTDKNIAIDRTMVDSRQLMLTLSRQSQLTLLSLLGDTGHWIGDTGCPIASLQTRVFICPRSQKPRPDLFPENWFTTFFAASSLYCHVFDRADVKVLTQKI